MLYRNPVPPETAPDENEGREFLRLLTGIGLFLAALVGAVLLLSDSISARVPFSVERSWAENAGATRLAIRNQPQQDQGPEALALRALGQRVQAAAGLPEGMAITLHYSDSPMVNAGATLGGHVIVYRGLIAKLDSEDALAAVLAHEVGHVRGRHVIRGLGRGVMLIAALGAVGVNSRGLTHRILGKGTELTALSFSRDAERESDALALDVVQRLYGHTAGVTEVFTLFQSIERGGLEMARTHPLSKNRLRDLDAAAARLGYPRSGDKTPLAPALAALSAPTRASGSKP